MKKNVRKIYFKIHKRYWYFYLFLFPALIYSYAFSMITGWVLNGIGFPEVIMWIYIYSSGSVLLSLPLYIVNCNVVREVLQEKGSLKERIKYHIPSLILCIILFLGLFLLESIL